MNIKSYNVEGLLFKLYGNSFFKNIDDFDIVCLFETFVNTDDLPDDFLPSIKSYNVEGLLFKLYGNSFFKNIDDFDIVCLFETFVNTDDLPDDFLPSIIRYFPPALKLSAHGSCSVGAVVFVKKSLKDFCEIIKHDFDNVIALKLRNACEERNGDIIVVSAYIPPHSSPSYNTVEYDNGIHMLEQCITELQTKHLQCSFVLCGDLNTRTSCAALNGVRNGIQICRTSELFILLL